MCREGLDYSPHYKISYLTDVGGIVLQGRITTEMSTWSLGQFIGVFSPADFCTVCLKE